MSLTLQRATTGTISSTVENNNQAAIEAAVNTFDGALINAGSINGSNAIGTGTIGANPLASGAVREAAATYEQTNSGLLVARVPGYFGAKGTMLQAFSMTDSRIGSVNAWQIQITYNDKDLGGDVTWGEPPYLLGLTCECATDRLESHRISSRTSSQIVIELYFDATTNEDITISGLLWGKPTT